jgi:hypothetical protein
MHAYPRAGRKWRRFTRKYGALMFAGCVLITIIALVGFLMYVLTSPEWRVRW